MWTAQLFSAALLTTAVSALDYTTCAGKHRPNVMSCSYKAWDYEHSAEGHYEVDLSRHDIDVAVNKAPLQSLTHEPLCSGTPPKYAIGTKKPHVDGVDIINHSGAGGMYVEFPVWVMHGKYTMYQLCDNTSEQQPDFQTCTCT